MNLDRWLSEGVARIGRWQAGFGAFEPHESVAVSDERFAEAFAEFTERLSDNYPFFHPRYAGQMVKPAHPAAIAGYLTAMLLNPNNHALDGGPATARMEREAVAQLAQMFGFDTHLGHLTTSGTIANLEALFVARESHPDKEIAFSVDAHYTHARMCSLLRIPTRTVPVDAAGRIDLDALRDLLRTGRIGTVVLTAGTTGLGAIDQIHEALPLAREYGARVHVDAAYGGFFTLLAGTNDLPAEPWQAIAACDSVVVDPHKHGLQPYGCGAVLFRDPGVGRFYQHDSPYTYFTSDDLHLGEISLECSRPGAAAAAFWLTLQVFPLTRDGLGRILQAGRRAAQRWADLLDASERLHLYQWPDLDIVAYFPVTAGQSLTEIDAASTRVLAAGMQDKDDPVFLSTLRVAAEAMNARHEAITVDSDGARILRSVLMKPESEAYVEKLHKRVEQLAGA